MNLLVERIRDELVLYSYEEMSDFVKSQISEREVKRLETYKRKLEKAGFSIINVRSDVMIDSIRIELLSDKFETDRTVRIEKRNGKYKLVLMRVKPTRCGITGQLSFY
jgi:hypothetical protein